MCQRFDVTGNLKNFANFFGTKLGLWLALGVVTGQTWMGWDT
jgi:hypothetical protein